MHGGNLKLIVLSVNNIFTIRHPRLKTVSSFFGLTPVSHRKYSLNCKTKNGSSYYTFLHKVSNILVRVKAKSEHVNKFCCASHVSKTLCPV
jgi:hypothetical protein